MRFHFYCREATLLLAATACTTSAPVSSLPPPVPAPETTAQTPENTPLTASFWKIVPSSQPQRYSSELSTVISEINGSTARRDSLTTRATYSLSTSRSADSVSFSGSIDSYSLQGSGSQTTQLRFDFPILFTGRIAEHNISSQRANTANTGSSLCGDSSRIPLRIAERALFVSPLELNNHQSWTDSTSSVVCSGTLPLTVFSIRKFRVVGESQLNGISALVIDQNEKTFSQGEGSQEQHRIFVEGHGSTTGHLYIDRASGGLLQAKLASSDTLFIRSSGRVQQFLQSSTAVTTRSQ